MSVIKRFIDFLNEEYELVTKMKDTSSKQPEELKKAKLKLPYHLEDHSILALADEKVNSHNFVELCVHGNDIRLTYGNDEKRVDEDFNFFKYKTIADLIKASYSAWKAKVEEFNLTDDDILVDELSSYHY